MVVAYQESKAWLMKEGTKKGSINKWKKAVGRRGRSVGFLKRLSALRITAPSSRVYPKPMSAVLFLLLSFFDISNHRQCSLRLRLSFEVVMDPLRRSYDVPSRQREKYAIQLRTHSGHQPGHTQTSPPAYSD
jgi:hypothetical protein